MTGQSVLMLSALSIGAVHTVVGPDHYIPFVVLARASNWSLLRTLVITALCGVGHVLSSVLIGVVGVAAGLAVTSVAGVEEQRGLIATWTLIGFGLAYGVWGVWKGLKGHAHTHDHGLEHGHEPHDVSRAVWWLFIVFVLGPCEPLIPLLMYPAAEHDWTTLVLVTATFGVVTILTMLVLTTLGWLGVRAIRLGFMERFVHALAGGVLALSGVVVMVLDV